MRAGGAQRQPSFSIVPDDDHHFDITWILILLGFSPLRDTPGTGRATHVDAGAVAAGDLRIDEPQQHDPAVERDDLAILHATGFAGRSDIIPAAGAALEAQLRQLRLIGEVHHHAAGRAGIDDDRLAALAARGGFGPRPVLLPMIGGIAPTPDHL